MVSSSNLPDRPSRRGSPTLFVAPDTSFASDPTSERMRPRPEPVKLRIANVCSIRIEGVRLRPPRPGLAGIAISLKTPRNTAYFRCLWHPGETAAGRYPAIDGTGSLPYKPRQLSAMARFDRDGPFGPEMARVWGRHFRT